MIYIETRLIEYDEIEYYLKKLFPGTKIFQAKLTNEMIDAGFSADNPYVIGLDMTMDEFNDLLEELECIDLYEEMALVEESPTKAGWLRYELKKGKLFEKENGLEWRLGVAGNIAENHADKRKTIYIMMGIQGSGKSTFCNKFLPETARINLDTLHTRNKESLLIADCQEKECDYVIDNTNPTRKDRARYISVAKEAGYYVIGFFLQSRLQECIERNNKREGKGKIPAKAIAMTSNILEMPSCDEGFDELYFVKNDGENMSISEWSEE